VLSLATRLVFLHFYIGLFSTYRKARYCIIGGMIFVVIVNLSVLLTLVLRCNPVQRLWNPKIPGSCVKAAIVPYILAAASPVCDLHVWALPILILWHLKLDSRKRIRVIAIFSIGAL
jgi:hypothetical protein